MTACPELLEERIWEMEYRYIRLSSVLSDTLDIIEAQGAQIKELERQLSREFTNPDRKEKA